MNIKGLKTTPPPPPTLDQQLQKAAKMYEQQFLGEMMRAMNNTVKPTDEPSMAQRIYKDEMNDLYVEKWAENGGNGLADQIYKELKEKILPSQHGRYVNQGAGNTVDGKPLHPAKIAAEPSPVPNEKIKK